MITYPTDKLQKVVLGGGCEQRNIPKEYTQVEYIDSITNQYINTGITPTANVLRIKTKCQKTSDSLGGSYFGVVADPAPRNGFRIYSDANNGKAVLQSGTAILSLDNQYDDALELDITIKQGTEIVCTLNGQTTTLTSTGVNLTNSNSMVLFGTRINAPYSANNRPFRFWSFYVEKDGVIAGNFISCRRNSDNVLGMFDLVSQTFFTNAGAGSFTAGADVVPTPDTPMDIVCNNGAVKVSKNLFDKSIFASSNSSTKYTPYQVPNGIYTMSSLDFPFYNSVSNVFFLAGDVSTGASSATNGVAKDKPITITVTDGYYTVAHRTTSANQYLPRDYNWQIEQGSTATPYMPYGQIYTDGTVEQVIDNLGNTANAEMLLAVGNYKDIQSVLDGVVTRNVGIKVLDGTEVWSRFNNLNVLQTNVLLNGTTSGRQVICNYLYYNKLHLSTAMLEYGECFKGDVGSSVFYINVGTYTNTLIDEWKAFLAERYASGNPVIVIYPLATATTEQVTPQPLAGSSATVTAGSIDNLPIESSTIAELKKRYIGDNEVKRVYIGDNLMWENN